MKSDKSIQHQRKMIGFNLKISWIVLAAVMLFPFEYNCLETGEQLFLEGDLEPILSSKMVTRIIFIRNIQVFN